jgi:hypothetical protein
MPGTKVTANTTYCGHIFQAEVQLNRHKDWIGRCVVTGPFFNGSVTLYAPLRTPTAALDAILTMARHSVDEERGAGPHVHLTGKLGTFGDWPKQANSSCNSERGQ